MGIGHTLECFPMTDIYLWKVREFNEFGKDKGYLRHATAQSSCCFIWTGCMLYVCEWAWVVVRGSLEKRIYWMHCVLSWIQNRWEMWMVSVQEYYSLNDNVWEVEEKKIQQSYQKYFVVKDKIGLTQFVK